MLLAQEIVCGLNEGCGEASLYLSSDGQYNKPIIMTGMFVAFGTAIWLLPEGVGLLDATRVAGTLGRREASGGSRR